MRLIDELLGPILREGARLEALAGLPAGSARIRWEQDENGWPTKAVVYIPEELLAQRTGSVPAEGSKPVQPATESPRPPVPKGYTFAQVPSEADRRRVHAKSGRGPRDRYGRLV